MQLGPHPIQNATIFTGFALPEQPCRRIPRAVVPTEQPTPIGPVRQKDPGRAPQRAGEMDDAGIYRDHEIEARNEGRGFREIGEVSGEIYDFSPFEDRLVVRSRVLLQTDKSRIHIQDMGQQAKRNRTVVVVVMSRIAGPDEANP